jgi:hypothetical protein
MGASEDSSKATVNKLINIARTFMFLKKDGY